MRLHALILAARFGVPFLALPYDPKVTGLVEDLDYDLEPLWTPGTPADLERVARLIDEAWSRREEIAARLLQGAAEQCAHAARNFDVLEALLQR